MLSKKTISTPDEALDEFFKWFDTKKRLAFVTAIIVGIITHINMMTETIMSQDGLWNSIQYFKPGDWEITLGRWGILLIQRLNGFLAIPTISTISCIILMGITAVILIDLFELKSKVSIIFTSSLLVLIPSFTVTLLYIYTSFSYCFCMLTATLTIWLMYKFKYKKIGIILGMCSFILTLSIYQSYIGVTIGLCIMILILELLRAEKKPIEVIKNILITAGLILLSAILYFILTKLILFLLGLGVADYKGKGISVSNIFANLLTSIKHTYKDFMAFFFRDRIVYNSNFRREIIYLIFFIITGLFGIINLYYMKYESKNDRIYKIALVCLLTCFIPVGLNIINILMGASEIYVLTTSQMILVFPFSFALIENTDKYVIAKWISVFSCILIIGTYYLSTNVSYAAMKLTYNQAYSTTERIIDRMESMPEYEKTYPIVFGGIVGNNNYPRTSNLYNYTICPITTNTTFHGTYSGQIGTWVNFIRIFFGMDVIPCDENIYVNTINSEEYKEMGIFPEENSIVIRDGIIIIKLSDDPPRPF